MLQISNINAKQTIPAFNFMHIRMRVRFIASMLLPWVVPEKSALRFKTLSLGLLGNMNLHTWHLEKHESFVHHCLVWISTALDKMHCEYESKATPQFFWSMPACRWITRFDFGCASCRGMMFQTCLCSRHVAITLVTYLFDSDIYQEISMTFHCVKLLLCSPTMTCSRPFVMHR